MMEHLLSGEVTVEDRRLFDDLRVLYRADGIFIEPSACAAFQGFRALGQAPAAKEYLAAHILWATGGSLVPAATRADYLEKRL